MYVNGEFVPSDKATVSVFDRGFLFGDGIYEVVTVVRGGLLDGDLHLQRLQRSLREVGMSMPMTQEALTELVHEMVYRNKLEEGVVYMQVTRGAMDRSFIFPSAEDLGPSSQNIVMFTQPLSILDTPTSKRGLNVKSVPDLRWHRCDIKTVQLLGASLMKTQAVREGFDGIWFINSYTNKITEGDSNNCFIVRGNTVYSPSLDRNILPGITRAVVREIIEKSGDLKFEEADFTVADVLAADEAFSSSAGLLATPVVSIDKQPIGSGKVGPISQRIRQMYIDRAISGLVYRGRHHLKSRL